MIHLATNDKELALAISKAEDGDIIELSGVFGPILIEGGKYNKVVVGSERILGCAPDLLGIITIRSADPLNRATVSSVKVKDSDLWWFECLDIRPGHKPFHFIAMDIEGSACSVSNCHITYGDNTGWTAQDWLDKAGAGIVMRGEDSRIKECTMENVSTGFMFVDKANHGIAENNTVRYFARDGFRSTVDRVEFNRNYVSCAVKVDDNHDDMAQFYQQDKGKLGDNGVIEGIVLESNYLDGRLWDHPLATTPHGISFFKVTADSCVIRNNIVLVDHWNGIVLENADYCELYGNRVDNPDNKTGRYASIRVKGDGLTHLENNKAQRIRCSPEVQMDGNVETNP